MNQSHFDEVLRLNNGNVPAVSYMDRAELEVDLALAQHALVIGADTVADTVAGFCTTFSSGLPQDLGVNYAWFAARYPSFVYLDRVVIDEPFRSHGLGQLLYGEVEQRIRNEGRTNLFTCEVNLQPRNEGSLRFHARLGFTQVGEQESKPGLIVAMLAKQLD
ncbi:MAG: hypothetical protein RLZZ518_1346 [Actinomycetota bacterium]